MSKNVIIIIEEESSIKSPKFLKLIEKYGNIYFNCNNRVKKFSHNSINKEPIKVITYKELLITLANCKNNHSNSNTFDYFIKKGLDKNVNPDACISMLIKNNNNMNITHLESYDFSYKDKKEKVFYDIPYYHENVPDGFSVFCTDEEYKLVLEYVNKKRKKSKGKKNVNNFNKEDISSLPEPTKKNYICHLCRVYFNNYKKHINSEKHKNMILENKSSFKELSDTFKRTVQNTKFENKNNSKSMMENENDSYYYLRNKNSDLCEKYFDDYIIFNKRSDTNSKIKIDKDVPSTNYSSLKNSSINFDENKIKKDV